MTKPEAARYLYAQRGTVSWICNVFQTSGGKNCATSLKALAKLHQAGHDIAALSFVMPYEALLIDGKQVTPAEMREMAAKL